MSESKRVPTGVAKPVVSESKRVPTGVAKPVADEPKIAFTGVVEAVVSEQKTPPTTPQFKPSNPFVSLESPEPLTPNSKAICDELFSKKQPVGDSVSEPKLSPLSLFEKYKAKQAS